MIALEAKQVFGAWPVVLAVLAVAVVLDAAGLWHWRHRRAPALALGAVGVVLVAVSVMFSGLLLALSHPG